MQKIATWEKKLRVTVSVAVLCCAAPHSSALAWDRLHPKEIPTTKQYDLVEIIGSIQKKEIAPPAQVAQPAPLALPVEKKPEEVVPVAALPLPVAAPVTPVSMAAASPLSSSERIMLRPPRNAAPATAIVADSLPVAVNVPSSPIPVTAPNSPNQLAQSSITNIVVLRAPHNAQLPWITEQKLASAETVTAAKPVLIASAAPQEMPAAKLVATPYNPISRERQEPQNHTPVVTAAVQQKPVVQQVAAAEEENYHLSSVKQAVAKEYRVSEDHTVWRDEKEEQQAMTQDVPAMVLTPEGNGNEVAQDAQPITKILLDRIENAAQTSIEPAMTGEYAFTEAEMLARIAPSAGGDSPTILMPPRTAAPLNEPVILNQPVEPLPKLAIPAAEPAPAPDNFSLPIVTEPVAAPRIERASHDRLSQASRDILERIPPEPRYNAKTRKRVAIERERYAPKTTEEGVKKLEAYGMKIAIKRPKMDVFRALESAYNSLIAGDQAYAITQYKEVLDQDPENTLALFGLATTYHRAGQIKMARPLYSLLLQIDPHNLEGLNNFLVLLSDESPQDALLELKKLQRSHPSFSPVPAQMALIYQKMGEYSLAVEYMARALSISPENLKYQYNMAIIYDKMGDWEESAKWYQRLIAAHDRGEKIPGNAQEIQQRLTFIRSNTGSRHS